MINRSFVTGAVVAIAGLWAFHHFVRPVPGGKGQ